ncbi:hypothetical protein BpHYR1_003307 [Brachionus plicatilis]|uniref:Uncharacterized protein n=1 Tax=Brachionus plicatilis TaxID=10195 RepID=A0A3M7SV82_BRAPC|nr:hypothetical protein BpHYR1_003307 [Brachionus plicatilis]
MLNYKQICLIHENLKIKNLHFLVKIYGLKNRKKKITKKTSFNRSSSLSSSSSLLSAGNPFCAPLLLRL